MVNISELLTLDRIECQIDSTSKKRSLVQLGELLSSATTDMSALDIFDVLNAREGLGSTGLGHGIALPHGRLEGIASPIAAVITLKQGVDYDAPDQEPVNILFALLVPSDGHTEHLQILAQLARMLSDSEFREQLNAMTDSAALLEKLAAHGKMAEPI